MPSATEFRHIATSQLLAILFFLGIALGSTIQETRVVQLPPVEIAGQKYVMERAMKYHGTLAATYSKGVWRFINKRGKPCKLFEEESR